MKFNSYIKKSVFKFSAMLVTFASAENTVNKMKIALLVLTPLARNLDQFQYMRTEASCINATFNL